MKQLLGHEQPANEIMPSAAKAKDSIEAKEWFVNEEETLFRGSDYTTRDEDLQKLMKHFKLNFSKGDFYRYQTI